MSCGQGTIQSRGTCWFHSIINGFLLSEDGQKILYDKMKEFYSGLTPDEKVFLMMELMLLVRLKQLNHSSFTSF